MPRAELPCPAIDDRLLYDAFNSRVAFSALAVSVEIGLYEQLNRQAGSIPEIASWLGISPRAAEAIVATAAAMGFLEVGSNGRFRTTPVAEVYLLPESPFYRRDLANSQGPDVDKLRRALASSETPPQPLAVTIEQMPAHELEEFIGLMHAVTLAAGSGLATQPVFQDMRNMLDVGGGSGSICMAIAEHNPQIHCRLMDLEPVGRFAKRNIKERGLADRVSVVPGNMFEDDWPAGFDGVLFGNIFHDWDWESCEHLARRAYDALQPGGKICLHEMLLNENKDGPLTVALGSILMLLHEKGKQFTRSELKNLLTCAGFQDCQSTPSFGYYSLVTATKG